MFIFVENIYSKNNDTKKCPRIGRECTNAYGPRRLIFAPFLHVLCFDDKLISNKIVKDVSLTHTHHLNVNCNLHCPALPLALLHCKTVDISPIQ